MKPSFVIALSVLAALKAEAQADGDGAVTPCLGSVLKPLERLHPVDDGGKGEQ